MKARLLKNLRKDAEYAITIEYAYPMYVVTLNMAGFTTNGIIKERFTELERAMAYVANLRRSYILNTARLSRIGGRKLC